MTTTKSATEVSETGEAGRFAVASESPAQACDVFSHGIGPVPFRDSGVSPLHVSSFEGAQRYRGEFLTGARALGLDSDRKPLHPQQYVIADALNASTDDGRPREQVIGVAVPRRASKTTSLLAVALGRCMEREDYLVAYSAQTGIKARDRFLRDIVQPLERAFPDQKTAPFKINRSAGSPHVTFANGSQLNILPPIPDSFRGDAYDLVILDESQVHEPEASEELLGAIMPTFDTRPDAQLVVAGTTGEHRSGLLWDTLELGRKGEAGIVEYAAPEDTPWWEEGEPVEGTIADEAVWRAAHPGIDTLTTIEAIRRNFATLTRAAFAREYGGLWPIGIHSVFINTAKWSAAALPFSDKPSPPAHFTVGVSVHMDQTSAAVVAAWRVDGVAYGAVLDHRSGTRWLAQKIVELHRKYGMAFVYDKDQNVTAVEIAKVQQARVARLKLVGRNWSDVSTAAALIYKEIGDGNLRHYSQPMLDAAVSVAVRRGTPNSKRWAFGRGSTQENDITPLEAFAIALHAYDELKPRAALRPPSLD